MNLKMMSRFSAPLAIFLFSIASAFAGAPQCLDNNGKLLPVMNEEVLKWKVESKNQYKDRAMISGKVTRILLERKTHTQFEIKIGDGPKDTIEVIYNVEFGELPQIREGMQVEACGDYITAREQAGGYPPSPSGAIIHWVHYNPGDRDGGRHKHGFVMVDGVLYGNQNPLKSNKPRRNDETFSNDRWYFPFQFAPAYLN